MNCAISFFVAGVVLSPSQLPVVDSANFSRELQLAALTATVRIRNVERNNDGSGVLIGKEGAHVYVMTAQHVVQGAERLEVSVFGKESYPKPQYVFRSATVVAESRGLADLALLRIPTNETMPGFLPLCPQKLTPTGSAVPVMACGCEAGKIPTLLLDKTVGKKMARRPEQKDAATFWQLDVKRAPGNSGGPLLDTRGYLLGICSGTNQEKTYFTHNEEIQSFLRKNGFRWLAEEKTPK